MKGVERCIPNLIVNGTTGAVVTLGKDGLVAEVNASRFSIPAPKVKVKDTTGAGDVVTAALIYGETRGWTMEKTLQIAVGVGVRKVSLRGGCSQRLSAGLSLKGEIA
jgi:sugar/nucleoside kinase (ribokinase family)